MQDNICDYFVIIWHVYSGLKGSLHVFQLDWHLGWWEYNYEKIIREIRYQK